MGSNPTADIWLGQCVESVLMCSGVFQCVLAFPCLRVRIVGGGFGSGLLLSNLIDLDILPTPQSFFAMPAFFLDEAVRRRLC